MTQPPRLRFAPSPTGRLHVGNLRAAIINALFVEREREAGSRLILRFDDTDKSRCSEESVVSIREDLSWLNITWDEEFFQSQRLDRYEKVFDDLKARGLVYPCYESSEELTIKRKILLSRGKPPVYDRAALELGDEDRAQMEDRGIIPYWRFKLDTKNRITFHDLIQGDAQFDPGSISDPVIRRHDGSWLYMLPSVIDDIDMGITHVVRGQDHMSNTAVQCQMFEAISKKTNEGSIPQFAHLALLSTHEESLSKRLGSVGVDHYRQQGIEPETLIAYLALMGTSDPIEPITDRRLLAENFDWSRYNKANALFDPHMLQTLNRKIIHHIPYDTVQSRLNVEIDAESWNAFRGNIDRLSELEYWVAIISAPVTPVIAEDDQEFLSKAADILEKLQWNEEIWGSWTGALKDQTGRKGRNLFKPLRLALTGEAQGPDMASLLVRIGCTRSCQRLRGKTA